MLRSAFAIAPLLCVSAACSIDLSASGTDGVGTDGTSATDTDATGGTTAEPTTGEAFEPFPARGGIVIDRVEANSGVAVPIGKDGADVPGAERGAYLPARRDTMVRAYFKLPEGWVPRELEAQLHLTGGGVDKVYKSTMLVENDSREALNALM